MSDDHIPSELKGPTILIVDDTPIELQIMAMTLSNEGYQIAVATNGKQALDMVGKITPDLILLDIMMPEMDGFEVCKILKGSVETRDVPVIFLTVKDEMEDILKGYEAGAVDYVTKPFNSAELLARIRTHAELKKKRGNEKNLISKLKAALAERGRAEEALQRAHDNLERLVEERTAELLSKNQQLLEEIEDRKRTENALRDSEERFRRLHEASFGGIGIHDKGVILEANQGLSTMTGYTLSELIGMDGLKLIHPEWCGLVMRNILSDYEKPYEVMGLKKNGSTYPLEIQGKVIPYLDRKVRVTEFRDITERKQAEDKLRESEQKYRHIYENIQDLYYEISYDGIILELSPSIERLTKYTRDELIGKSVLEIYAYPEERHKILKEMQKTGIVTDSEMTLKDKDGRFLTWSLCSRLVRDERGIPHKIIGSMRNITARKLVEMALKESEQKLYTTIQGSPIPTFVIGKDHRVIYWNRALENLSKMKAKAMIGTNQHWRAFYGTERPCLADLLLDDATEKIPQWYTTKYSKSKLVKDAYEATDFFPELGKGGKWLRFTAAAIKDSVGNLVGAVETFEDITESKKMGEMLQESETKYRTIFETTASAIMIVEEDTTISLSNTAFEKLTGYSKNEVEGKKSWAELVVKDDLARMQEYHRLRRIDPDAAPRNYEFRFIHRDGKIRDAFATIAMIPGTKKSLISILDITDRKHAEETLRESEEKYRSLASTEDSMYLVDRDCRYLFMNEGHLSRFGMTLDKVVGRSYSEFHSKKYTKEFTKKVEHVFETGTSIQHENKSERDGRYFLRTFSPVKDKDGRATVAVTVVSKDITDRKAAEEALAKSEERYRRLVESVTDYIYSVKIEDGHSVATTHGPACITVTGYTAEEYDADPDLWFQMVYPDDREAVIKQTHCILSGENPPPIDHRIIHKDGSIRWVRNTSVLFHDSEGRLVGYDGMVSDITVRKYAMEQLRQSKDMLRMVFDGISDPLIMLDKNHVVKMLNRAARDYYKLNNYRDAIGKPCFNAFFGESGPCEGCEYPLSAMKGYVGTFERKGRMDPDRLEQVVVYPVKDEAGGPDATIVRISDITESRLMQRQIMQSEKLASLGLLVSGIAHEINNPNSFIVFNIPILREYTENLLPIIDEYAENHPDFELFGMPYQEFRKDIFKLLDNIEHGSHRITNTVSRLKGFARRRDRQGRYKVDLKQVVEQGVDICRSEIKKTVRSFEVDIPENLPQIFTDPEALEQILINLLINAAQASDKEDSWIRLSVLSVDRYPHHHVIEVSDNGCGMDEKIKEKIFDPFFTTKASVGTGLGLYVCNTVVAELGGRIEVESKPGQGSTFRVILNNVE
ncbi:MAG TPA: PAS domain S-box protein [Syntrophales bacterium]|nr:PAS domain S-box protein [Syntrophales bacterium]